MGELQIFESALANAERKFTQIVQDIDSPVSYAVESMFALQAIKKNEYLMSVANKAPGSLRDAIINISSIGISLNPAMQYAYLVPRDGIVCLDISYKGLIKLATDSASMLWVRADLVYEHDLFKYKGPADKPEHIADVFVDRGVFKGVYCLAKTLEGDFLTEVMTAAEIEQVRDSSPAWAKKKKGPWKDWFGEMAKKTVIKRASKTWPRSDKNDRLAKAIEVINEHEGFTEPIEDVRMIAEDQINVIESTIADNGIDRDEFLEKIAGVNDVAHITASDYERCHNALLAKIGVL